MIDAILKVILMFGLLAYLVALLVVGAMVVIVIVKAIIEVRRKKR